MVCSEAAYFDAHSGIEPTQGILGCGRKIEVGGVSVAGAHSYADQRDHIELQFHARLHYEEGLCIIVIVEVELVTVP